MRRIAKPAVLPLPSPTIMPDSTNSTARSAAACSWRARAAAAEDSGTDRPRIARDRPPIIASATPHAPFHVHSRTSGMSSPYRSMYWRCSINLSRIACFV